VQHFPVGSGMPSVPEGVPLGVPADLLRRRPDVMQAQYAAAAQSARIGVASSALYPSFTLNGAIGYSGMNGTSNLFNWDNRAIAYGLEFNLPIFDRGRISEQVKVQDSLFRQSVLAYQNQVLKAQQEVDDALSAMSGNARQLSNLQQADKAAARTSSLAQLRYRAGQVDYTTVTSAVQAHLQTSDAVVQIEGGVLLACISAYRALGGGWDSTAQAESN
jgi:outer membrane protein TolC